MSLFKPFLLIYLLFLIGGLWTPRALAESLTIRLADYPNWENKPTLTHQGDDINYPDWFEGTWEVTSILIEQIAPFAPTLVTPGFESNRHYLQKPVTFLVRFQPYISFSPVTWAIPSVLSRKSHIIADRRFNGWQIARAYLGEKDVLDLEVTSGKFIRIFTRFPQGKRMISTVIGHNQKKPSTDQFLTTELTTQQFEDGSQRYLNDVETTTAYHFITPKTITAEQITAIYLSP